MEIPSTPPPSDPPRATRWWDEPAKNLPGKMKLGMAVGVGFVLMSMFMNLQGPAPALPTARAALPTETRTPPATDERTARLETDRMQQAFEATSAKVDQVMARTPLTPAPTAAAAQDSYELPGATRSRPTVSSGSGEESAAPKPGFVTRRRETPAAAAPVPRPDPDTIEPAFIPQQSMDAPARLQTAQAPAQTPARTSTLATAAALARRTTLREGTVIDAVLANRLNGSAVGPVVARVTNPIYGYDGTAVLIPQGATVIGASQAVTEFGQSRLAVSFHRLQMPPPDGRSYDLNQFTGLSQIGDVGLRDQVNAHYLSMFGASAMVGLINGLAQTVGNIGSGRNNATIVLGDMGNQTSQTSGQLMQKFLNRPPDVTIRAGDRVKVYVTSDLEIPIWGGGR